MFVELTAGAEPDRAPERFRMHYERGGAGPTVLYIGGSGRGLADRPNVFDSPLPERASVIGFDQRGLGATGSPPGAWTMADYADDAAALLDALAVSDCCVVGVSFGGMVAQELAIRHPDRVRRLVLVVTSAGGAGGSSYPIHELETYPPRERFELELVLADTRRDPAWRAAHPDEVDVLWERVSRTRAPLSEGERKQLDARREHDCWERLDRITAPTLVCAGRYDGVAPMENSRAIVSRIADARLAVFDGGHLLLHQDPAAWREVVAFVTDGAQKSMLI